MNNNMHDPNQVIQRYWERSGIERQVLEALDDAGISLADLTIEKLAPLDQFHSGGLNATLQLAHLAEITPGVRVIDVGGGFGGPARTLAAEFGCYVTSIDLSESYIRAARMLTEQIGLEHLVQHHVGNALDLQFDSGTFDFVWTQNSGMNIERKADLYAGFHKVLRSEGRLVFQEPMAGHIQPILYPVMWADDPRLSFLRTPEEMREIITSAGFTEILWKDVTHDLQRSTVADHECRSIQSLVMGETLESILQTANRNRDEGRIVMTHAVYSKLKPQA